jgi:Sigma-70, region 4
VEPGATSDPAFPEDDDGGPETPAYALVIEKRFADLSSREQDVLRSRCEPDPVTLDEIGARAGLTRERVRQIEAQALDRLAGRPVLRPGRPRQSAVAAGAIAVDVDAAETALVADAVAGLGRIALPITNQGFIEAGFERFDSPTTRLLFAAAKRMGAFGGVKTRVVHRGGRQWLSTVSRMPERLMRDLTEGAIDGGVVEDLVEFWGGIEEKLRVHVGSDSEASDLAADLVDGLGLREIGGQYAVLGGVGVVEGLVRVLRANDAPMKRDVLVGCFADRSERTVSNALFDAPFVQVGREEFALQEWGASPRPALRDLVYDEIDRYGQVAVSYLQDLAVKHGYSRNSIAFYSALPDVIDDAGVLRRRRADDPAAVPEPGLDERCFRVVAGPYRGHWSCMVVVSHKRLYHGPQVIPTPLAELLEIQPGSRQVEITVNGTKINASWGQQNPYLFGGQLRPVLDELGFGDGELVRLVVVGPGELYVDPVPTNDRAVSPHRTLVTGAGLYDDACQPVPDADIAEALSFAVGLAPDAPLPAVQHRLISRHNTALRQALALIFPEVVGW